MAFYFSHFPTFDWNDENKNKIRSVDITRRYAFYENVLKNKYIMYTYEIKDGERADVIASKYYGDSSLDYLVLMMNTLIDPYFEWPMNYHEFKEFIIKKYGSLETARTTTVKYYKIIQERTRTLEGTFVPEKLVEVDAFQYATLIDTERKTVSAYDYEKELNEQRRKIKVIDKAYMPQIKAELDKILDDASTSAR